MFFIKDSIRTFFRKGDVLLLVLCLIASGCGLVLIFSATRYDPDLRWDFVKQAMFICLGIVAYLVCTFVDIELIIEKSWKLVLLLSFVLLFLIIPFGVEGDTGNKSWIYLAPHPGQGEKRVHVAGNDAAVIPHQKGASILDVLCLGMV